mmetsp:Transcript_7920/g.11557  ORF Transcript_7920/g.11557 Transcript_7920/m.11557 type:complete len:146 (+) Transcript_7920:283-720(+)
MKCWLLNGIRILQQGKTTTAAFPQPVGHILRGGREIFPTSLPPPPLRCSADFGLFPNLPCNKRAAVCHNPMTQDRSACTRVANQSPSSIRNQDRGDYLPDFQLVQHVTSFPAEAHVSTDEIDAPLPSEITVTMVVHSCGAVGSRG